MWFDSCIKFTHAIIICHETWNDQHCLDIRVAPSDSHGVKNKDGAIQIWF